MLKIKGVKNNDGKLVMPLPAELNGCKINPDAKPQQASFIHAKIGDRNLHSFGL